MSENQGFSWKDPLRLVFNIVFFMFFFPVALRAKDTNKDGGEESKNVDKISMETALCCSFIWIFYIAVVVVYAWSQST
jgi:hypothetical protein